MVSGFLISPNDHERIFSGEASAIRIWSKVGAAWTGLKMFRTSWFILVPSAGRKPAISSKLGRSGAPSPSPGRAGSPSAIFQLHVQAKGAHLLDQHVEAFRN